MTTPSHIPLAKPLQTVVNRLAYRLGQAAGDRIKVELEAELLAARAGGARFDELLALLADRARHAPARDPDA